MLAAPPYHEVGHRQRDHVVVGEDVERRVLEHREDDEDVADEGDHDHGGEGEDGDDGLPARHRQLHAEDVRRGSR